MAENEKNAYEDIHKKLSEIVQDAALNDVKEPKIDLSFLCDDKRDKTKRKKFVSIAAVAAVVIVVLFSANIILLSSDNADVYSNRGILHRLYYSIDKLFTDEDDEYLNDISSSIEVNNEDEFKDAKAYLPQLYLPRYIPDGYKLDKLYIEKYNSGDSVCIYNYSNNDNNILEISITYCNRNKFDYEYKSTGEITELPDRVLYLEWDKVQNEYYMTIYTEICVINIYMDNCTDKNDLIMIGKNMMK